MRLVVAAAAAVVVAASLASAAETYTTQSTVVNINYKNIFLLLSLKAVVVVLVYALSNGAGYGHVGYARAVNAGNGWPWVSREDIMFLTAFILSNDLQGHECISRVACLHPALARQLVAAAVFLSPWESGWLGQVQKARHSLEDGIHTHSLKSASCRQQHSCPQVPNL